MAFEISALLFLASAMARGAELLAPLAMTGDKHSMAGEHTVGLCLPPVLRNLTGAEGMRDSWSLSHGRGLRDNPFALIVEKPGVILFQHETTVKTDSSDPADRQASTLKVRIALPDDLELKSTTSLQRFDIEQSYDLESSSFLTWIVSGFRNETRFSENLFLADQKGSCQWLIVAYAERAKRVSSDRTKTHAGLKSAVFPKLIDPC